MQNTIYIAPDSAEQESLEAGVYAILKRWNYKNEKAMQKEVFDFCSMPNLAFAKVYFGDFLFNSFILHSRLPYPPVLKLYRLHRL